MKKPRRHQPLPRQAAVEQHSHPSSYSCGPLAPGAERGSHILQVVPDHAAAVLDDHGVQRVARFHVDEVGPRAEHLQRAQLAAVLVRHHIVGIVRPGAVVLEAADRTAGQRASGNGAVGAIGAAVRAPQHGVEIALLASGASVPTAA